VGICTGNAELRHHRERKREREREVTQLNSGTHTETDLLVDRLGKGIFCVVYIISGEIAIRNILCCMHH